MDIYPCGIRSPYYKITEYDGIIIGIGVTVKMASFVHCIEDIYPDEFPLVTRLTEIYPGKVIKSDGSEVIVNTLIANPLTEYKKITRYYRKNIPKHIYSDLTIGNVNYSIIYPKELFNVMRVLTHKGITMYTKKAFKILMMDKKKDNVSINYILLEKIGKGVIQPLLLVQIQDIFKQF